MTAAGPGWTEQTARSSPPWPGCSHVAAEEPARDASHAALALAAGPLAVDLSSRGKTAASWHQARGADRADVAGEPGWGYQRIQGELPGLGYQGGACNGAVLTILAVDFFHGDTVFLRRCPDAR
jgi:hypothetical protein